MVQTSPHQLLKKLREKFLEKFPEEAESMAFQIVEHFSGLSRTDILIDKPFLTGPQFDNHMREIAERILSNEPIQYVLGKAPFYGRYFEPTASGQRRGGRDLPGASHLPP